MAAPEIGESTKVTLDLKTIGMIVGFVITLAGMWFTLQADIALAMEKPEPVIDRVEYDLKDELIRQTIMDTQEDVDKILEDLKKLEDQIDETEKNAQTQLPMEPPFPLPPGQSKNSIFMSMMLPPDFIKNLIEEGYLDLDELDDFDYPEDDIGDFYEEINDHKYTGEEKTDPDYGNRWTDWNPDPLSDEYGDESL